MGDSTIIFINSLLFLFSVKILEKHQKIFGIIAFLDYDFERF